MTRDCISSSNNSIGGVGSIVVVVVVVSIIIIIIIIITLIIKVKLIKFPLQPAMKDQWRSRDIILPFL